MRDENDQTIVEKLNFFLEEKINIHIKFNNKRFMNGILTEKKSDNVFILNERKLGLVHMFVSDIFEVNEFLGDEKSW